jgi:prepilin peptidase CpaA
MSSGLIATVAFGSVMGVALGWDVAKRRIPNWLVLVGLLVGVVLRGMDGWASLGAGLAGAGLALALTFPLFALRAMGGGDVKLFGVAGVFLGPAGFLLALLASALVGGVLGLVAAIRDGVVVTALLRTRDLGVRAATLGRSGERMTLDSAGAITVPYGAAIAIGSLVVWFLYPGGLTWW